MTVRAVQHHDLAVWPVRLPMHSLLPEHTGRTRGIVSGCLYGGCGCRVHALAAVFVFDGNVVDLAMNSLLGFYTGYSGLGERVVSVSGQSVRLRYCPPVVCVRWRSAQ
jgi:hypothetical protein